MNDRYEIQYGGERFGWWRTLIVETDVQRALMVMDRFRNTPSTGHNYRLVHILDELEQ